MLAGYIYNSLLTGWPYFLQMIGDAEIATQFVQGKLQASVTTVTAPGNAYFLAKAISEILPGIGVTAPAVERYIRQARRKLAVVQPRKHVPNEVDASATVPRAPPPCD